MQRSMEEEKNLVSSSTATVSDVNALTKKTYFIRWWLLLVLLIENALNETSSNSFGTVNDVMVAYFDVSYEAVDWLFLAHWVTVLLCAPILAWFSFKNQLGFRKLAISQAITVFLSYVTLVIAVVWPKTFDLMLIGQFIDGIAFILTHIIPPVFAVHWFPNNEVGTAISVATAGMHIGGVISFLLPANILKSPPPITENFVRNSPYNCSSSDEDWYCYDREQLLWLYGTLLMISFVGLLFMCWFSNDYPPSPPTVAVALQWSSNDLGFKGIEKTWKNFLLEIKHLFCDCSFVLIVACFGIAHSVSAVETILLGEMIRTISPRLDVSVSSNQLTSFILLMISFGGILGAIISGKLVNINKNYLKQTKIGGLFLGVSNIGFLLAYYFENVPALFITNFAFGVAISLCLVPLFEMSTQQTFPIDESFTSVWLIAFFTPVIVVVCTISRIVMNTRGGLGVVIVQTLYSCLLFLLSFFIKPQNKRLEAEEKYLTSYGSGDTR